MDDNEAPRPDTCPSWCTVRHGGLAGEDDDVHMGGALLVKRTLMRLCATIERRTGVVDGPHVMVGPEEYSLHEAEVLIDALTQLVDQGRAESLPKNVNALSRP